METIFNILDFGAVADGKTDCTAALCRVFDDLLAREREGVEKTKQDLIRLSNNCEKDVFIGFEARTKKGKKLTHREREELIAKLTVEMKNAAKILEFEHAAYLRDKIKKLKEENDIPRAPIPK